MPFTLPAPENWGHPWPKAVIPCALLSAKPRPRPNALLSAHGICFRGRLHDTWHDFSPKFAFHAALAPKAPRNFQRSFYLIPSLGTASRSLSRDSPKGHGLTAGSLSSLLGLRTHKLREMRASYPIGLLMYSRKAVNSPQQRRQFCAIMVSAIWLSCALREFGGQIIGTFTKNLN